LRYCCIEPAAEPESHAFQNIVVCLAEPDG